MSLYITQFSENGLKVVCENFRGEKVVQQYEDIYRTINFIQLMHSISKVSQ